MIMRGYLMFSAAGGFSKMAVRRLLPGLFFNRIRKISYYTREIKKIVLTVLGVGSVATRLPFVHR
jgi:hypothetical protein